MATAAPAQTNFNGGELSPAIEGRVDINKYSNGCYAMRNFIPLVQGPARRRSGSRFVKEVKDSADRGWLAPFQFSDDTAFVIEFGDGYLRFYTNHGQLLTGAVAAYNGATNYVVGDLVTSAGVTYYCILATVGNAPPNATYWYALTGAAPDTIYEVPAPWLVADLTRASDGTFRLWMEQSGDVIYITHPSYQPRKLTRVSNTRWTLAAVDLKGGPFIGIDPDETRTVYASAATGAGITLTASAAIFTSDHIGTLFLLETKLADAVTQWEVGKVVGAGVERRSDGNVYSSVAGGTTGTVKPVHLEGSRYDGDAGVQWEYLHSGYGYVRITAIGGGGTTATADVVSRIPSQAVGAGNPTTRWSFSEFSTLRGWPSHVTFFKERLTLLRGTQLFMSVASDFENFANREGSEVTSDMAISINIASEQINDPAWIAPGNKLLVGTVGNEFAVGEITSSDPLGPGNIQAQAQTAHGSRQVRPVRVNDSVLFVQKAGRKLREIRFTFESDGYATTDLTVLAEHVTKGQIVQMAYQQEPHSIVWCAMNNGELVGFTFNREQDVLGWHPHPVGGDGVFVESVASIPSPDGARDELWMIVRRTINGATKRYVEYVERDWIRAEGMEIQDAFFVDSGLTYSGAPADVISGLDHLEGQTVQVLADGATHPDRTVAGGSITLQLDASTVHAGLASDARLTTMRIEAGAEQGTAQGRTKRVTKVVLRLLDTLGGRYGRFDGTLDEILYRSSAAPMDAPPPPLTGDTPELAWPDGYETEARLTVVQDQPLPMTLVAVFPVVSTQG